MVRVMKEGFDSLDISCELALKLKMKKRPSTLNPACHPSGRGEPRAAQALAPRVNL